MRRRKTRTNPKAIPSATLFLDPTSNDSLLLGLTAGKSIHHRRIRTSHGHHERILSELSRFLVSASVPFARLRALVIVNGPGRFSSLRVAAVIANTLAWVHGVPLCSAHRPKKTWFDDRRYLAFIKKSARTVERIHPFYGRPPSITKKQ